MKMHGGLLRSEKCFLEEHMKKLGGETEKKAGG